MTRLDGTAFALNCELLETVERTPDTVVTLVTGRKMVVREGVDEITRRVIEYRQLEHRCPFLRDHIDPTVLSIATGTSDDQFRRAGGSSPAALRGAHHPANSEAAE